MRNIILSVVLGVLIVSSGCQTHGIEATDAETKSERDSFNNSILNEANEMLDTTKPEMDTVQVDTLK